MTALAIQPAAAEVRWGLLKSTIHAPSSGCVQTGTDRELKCVAGHQRHPGSGTAWSSRRPTSAGAVGQGLSPCRAGGRSPAAPAVLQARPRVTSPNSSDRRREGAGDPKSPKNRVSNQRARPPGGAGAQEPVELPIALAPRAISRPAASASRLGVPLLRAPGGSDSARPATSPCPVRRAFAPDPRARQLSAQARPDSGQ